MSSDPKTARAFEINSLMVGAWMVREGLSDKPLPDLSGVSLNEAIEASKIVSATPPVRNQDGSSTLTCHVELSRIPSLYAWAVSTSALNRICQEHAR